MVTRIDKSKLEAQPQNNCPELPMVGQSVKLSVVVPVVDRHDDLEDIFQYFAAELDKIDPAYEFIFVLDGSPDSDFEVIRKLKDRYPKIKIIRFARSFGESMALSVGFERSQGQWILTIPPYFQIEPDGIAKIIEGLEEGYDLVAACRGPRLDSVLNRIQTAGFHWLVSRMIGIHFHDFGCGVRAMSRRVVHDLHLYGDLFRFVPLLAHNLGFKVKEVWIPQSKKDSRLKVYGLGVYLRRLLDIFTLFFLVKFTRKPLRFFGLIGALLTTIGAGICGYMLFERWWGPTQISNRPLLLLGSLLIAIGVQAFSIGLLGEIIIFTHAGDEKEYKVDEFIE
ncbi:MAG: glycosyltransferase [Acidobacteria bacterium]|nr:glycosyltransferase [Acidobacteriota bacterium]MBI3656059.1 glycosyltransferase [Acidobacteriota bacterium]